MKANATIRLLLALLLITGIVLAYAYRDQFDIQALEARVQAAGLLAPLIFMLVYAVGVVFFLPGSIMTLAGGALFGPVMGTFYNLTAATCGAALAFLLARYLAADWVAEKSGGRLKQLINGVEAEGWRFVAFVRLVPLFPFNLLNYGLGLTRIRFLPFLLATYVCMLPGGFAYTYLGHAGREALSGGEGTILLAIAVFAVVMFIPRLVSRLRRGPAMETAQLKQRLDANEDLLVLDVRSDAEFTGEQGHIERAINIPLEQLGERIDEISGYREKPVAVVCRTDRRSASAALLLAGKGFADVHVVSNGMTGWNRQGYPVER